MSAVVWFDGSLHSATDPIISAGNHGVTVGDGVFETMAIRQSVPFALTRHLVRLQYSLDRMGMREIDMSRVREGIAEVIAANPADVARIRVTVISGPGPMSSVRGTGAPSILVWGGPGKVPPTCRAVRSPWKRNERSAVAGVKTTSYAENVVMAQYAAGKGADETLMANTLGHLCEGTGSNVFIERDGEIVTPPLSSGCLAGVTRGLALEWGADAGVPIRVGAPGELSMSVLDEVMHGDAFAAVTSSTRGVQAVTWLDGVDLGTGKLLAKLSDVYEKHADGELDPAPPRSRARV